MDLLNNKIKILIVMVVLVIIGSLAYFLTQKYSPLSGRKSMESGIAITEIAPGQMPANFPSNLPIEEGAKLLQNYAANAPDNRTQATQVYTTKKSLSENLKIYSEYLQGNGWIIKTQTDNPKYKMLYAAKGEDRLQIDLTEQAAPLTNTVGISLTSLTK